MENKKIELRPEERETLKQFSEKGIHSVRLVRRARIILALDTSEGKKPKTQEEIATNVGVSRQTVNYVKKDFLEAENIEAFLQRKKRKTPPIKPKIIGETEARIIALACSEPPAGYAKWSLRMLANKMVELNYIDNLSHMSIGRVLKKLNLSLT